MNTTISAVDPASLVRPRRTITGMSAILLPMRADLSVDWEGFAAHVARTSAAGIAPAINMDTGYVQLIDLPPLNVATFREKISGGANQGRARAATRKEVHCGVDHREAPRG